MGREINDFALSRVRFLGSGPTAPNFPWTTPRLFVLTFVSMTEHVGNRVHKYTDMSCTQGSRECSEIKITTANLFGSCEEHFYERCVTLKETAVVTSSFNGVILSLV